MKNKVVLLIIALLVLVVPVLADEITTPEARPGIHRAPVKLKISQIGLMGGYFAGLPAVIAEFRLFEPFHIPQANLRLGVGCAQGKDNNEVIRKHGLLLIEGIVHINPDLLSGLNTYFGGGINYNVYTSGSHNGLLGGQAYLGLEFGSISSGQLFFEAGYSKIRFGDNVSTNSGYNALVGFRF
jgi:hypothetical protein